MEPENNELPPDCIFYGENIITMDESCTSPTALATRGGKILAVGDKESVFGLASADTKFVELVGNQTLLPGLIEAHSHAIHMIIIQTLFVDCSGYYYNTYTEIQNLIRKTVANIEHGKWCLFFGWDPELIRDLPDVNADMLDEFSKEIPIAILGQNGHIAWANHKALEMAGIDEESKDPSGGYFERDPETKKLTGKLMEPVAYWAVIGCALTPTYRTWRRSITNQWLQYAGCGFTTVTDLLFFPRQFDFLDKAVEDNAFEPDCKLRLALYKAVSSVDEPGGDSTTKEDNNRLPINRQNDKIWFAGVKIISDGSPHCGTVASREPFLENNLTNTLGFPPSPNYGKLNFTAEELYTMVKHWHDEGKQIAIHAHGERAIEQVLDVYEKIMTRHEDTNRRHRMEHLGLAEERHLIRAAKLNLALSFFVSHLYFYAKSYTEYIFGPERTKRWTPLSLATKHGLTWTLHQDNPAFPGPPEPFASIKTAVTRTCRGDPDTVYGEEYRVSVYQGLKAYTINAAWQIHKEKELGSLTVGKRADLVILSDNPLKVDPAKLLDIQVLDTYLDGRSNKLTERKETTKDGKVVYCYGGRK